MVAASIEDRLIWASEALQAQGHDVRIDVEYTYNAEWINTIQGPRLRRIVQPVDADVIVLQRPLHRNRFELVKALQAKGAAVVVEIDDDFHAIDKKNPAWKAVNPLSDPDIHRDWLMRACDVADLVTCATLALAERYGQHGRVQVIDNYVPARYCDIEKPAPSKKVTVGWSGSIITHPGDLEAAGGGITQAIEDHGARLGVVGTGQGVAEALGYTRSVPATGWLAIAHYPDALAKLDIGVVPLKPIPFNEAKSHLKGIEYAACGVPFVAAPTGPYRRLAEAGIGWIADTPADWRWLVGDLIRDENHRLALGAEYRAAVAKGWTVEANAWRWAEAWAQALANRRERVAA